jgi:hypothetical protein
LGMTKGVEAEERQPHCRYGSEILDPAKGADRGLDHGSSGP